MRALANGLLRLFLLVLIASALTACSVARLRTPYPQPAIDDAFWRDVFDIPNPKEKKP